MEFKLTANVDGTEYDVIKSEDCDGCVFKDDLSLCVCNHSDNHCSELGVIYVTKGFKPRQRFKPLDQVLVRDKKDDTWQASFVSYEFDGSYYTVDNIEHNFIIPLNEETKYLWNTKKEAPEKYKWW